MSHSKRPDILSLKREALAWKFKPNSNMKYTYRHKDEDDMTGVFDTLQAAYDAAKKNAVEWREATDTKKEIAFEIFDTRPADGDDRQLFDGVDNFEHIDFSKDGWWNGLVVPENIVLVCTFG